MGTGVIGAGWAARFLAKGYTVKAYDPNSISREQLKINVRTAFKSLKKIGLNRNASLRNLKVYSKLPSALKDTTFVQENAPENEKIKKNILKQIDNTPDDKKEQIVKGKLNKFIKENTLMGQALITDPKNTVANYVSDLSKSNN